MSDIIPEHMTSPVETIQDGLRKLQQKDWKQELQNVGFAGDVRKGTILMNEFTQGEADVIRALDKRDMIQNGYSVPDVKFVSPRSPNPEDSYAAYCHTEGSFTEEGAYSVSQEIHVNPNLVEDLTKHDIEQVVNFTGKNGEVITQGSLKDIFYQLGLEEAAHSVYRNNNIPESSEDASSVGQKTLAQIDATPVEYHGLGWKIRGVMDRSDLPDEMKQIILQPLKRRMHEAIQYRQTLNPPKETARDARARLKEIAEGK